MQRIKQYCLKVIERCFRLTADTNDTATMIADRIGETLNRIENSNTEYLIFAFIDMFLDKAEDYSLLTSTFKDYISVASAPADECTDVSVEGIPF